MIDSDSGPGTVAHKCTLSTMNSSRHVTYFRQLGMLQLDSRIVMPSLLRSVRRMVEADFLFFFWTNEKGAVLAEYEDPPSPEGVRERYFAKFHDVEQPGLPPFSTAARFGPELSVVPDLPQRVRRRSAFWNEILNPLGSRYQLVMVLREGTHPEGVLVMHRSALTGPFSHQEAQVLREIRPYITQGLGHTPPCPATGTLGAPAGGDGATRMVENEEGLLILDRWGRLLSRCATSGLLLQMMQGARLPQARLPEQLPSPVTTIHRKLLDAEVGGTPFPPLVVVSAWGRFRLRACWLDGADGVRVGITIRREIPLRLRLWERLYGQPLSARQGELCLWLADDLSYAEIAERMGISRHTVVEYTQTIYRKLGVSGKEALIERLLHPPPTPG
ncbi:helix-turn-helix transcriptional regulator [Alkalilimnicola ehrlichii MLHE-1]|uniref:Transcriptional regulator, LuxR family n=1 Tax=Alkalilimnicola ehrlichii (strain ATCC BAA-1101 / DSM 17681 / MLHE-1) TaxID=187272 RepID=Q0A561_ALKEH|nr:helix-turn-helix transcriptional regulator [Alkalilimnicola ehrlichii]ABI58026.1 transcriptional regulator, LuxR family [Alkalilimnicola ehrlichii MLHE-1]